MFTNRGLQALYNELITHGSQSLAEAIQVGGAIEEIDILDLQERLAQIDNTDIQQVFTNLLNGSYNHLRAFVSNLKIQTGETYQPQYLSAEAYQAIIGNDTSSGGNSGDTPIVHTGLEFVYCLEGCIGYEVDGQAYTLNPGDSLLFEAHLPHRWRNAGNTPSRSLLLLCPTDERDHPDERHFTYEV